MDSSPSPASSCRSSTRCRSPAPTRSPSRRSRRAARMSIALFVLRRVGRGVFTLLFAVTVTFLLLRLLPGDPALAIPTPTITHATRAVLLPPHGIDHPHFVHYFL